MNTSVTYLAIGVGCLSDARLGSCLRFETRARCSCRVMGRIWIGRSLSRSILLGRISGALGAATMLTAHADSVVPKGGGTIVTCIFDSHSNALGHSFVGLSGPHVPIRLIQLEIVFGKDCLSFAEAHLCFVSWIRRCSGTLTRGCVCREFDNHWRGFGRFIHFNERWLPCAGFAAGVSGTKSKPNTQDYGCTYDRNSG